MISTATSPVKLVPDYLISELQRRYSVQTNGGRLLAVVLHGSTVRMQQDDVSDLDLLLITDQTAPAFHAVWSINGTPCDLHVTSVLMQQCSTIDLSVKAKLAMIFLLEQERNALQLFATPAIADVEERSIEVG